MTTLKEQYNWLSIDKLKRLPTKRLLAYYKKVRPSIMRAIGTWCPDYGICEECGREQCSIWAAEAEEYRSHILEILNTREHIE